MTFQSGFPIGVSQNLHRHGVPARRHAASEHRPGRDFLVPGDITERIKENTADNLYLNKAAFSTAPANQFGNAPRTLPGVYSPWRNNVDLSVSKSIPDRQGRRRSMPGWKC